MSSAAPAPGTANLHDVPNVWLLNMPRHKYVRDGGRMCSKKQEGEGGHMKFYLYERGAAEKVLAMLKGGTTSFWVAFMRWLEVLAMLMGGGGKVSTL